MRVFLPQAFVKQRGLSDSVRINRVVENGETADFKTIFKVWDKPLLPGQTKVYSPNRIGLYKHYLQYQEFLL